MIDPAVLLTLETKNEIHIAILLSTSGKPMRHVAAIMALGAKIKKQQAELT